MSLIVLDLRERRKKGDVRISGMHIFRSRKLGQGAVPGIVELTVHQAGGVEPHGISRELDGGRCGRQTITEGRPWSARNGLVTKAFLLLVGGIPVRVTAPLDAVCHRLKPRRIASAALVACHAHHCRVPHAPLLHAHEGGAGQVEGRERVVTCLAAKVRVQ